MEVKIIFENEDHWVINKPSGVVVNRAESVEGETVQDWVERTLSLRGVSADEAIQVFPGSPREYARDDDLLFRKRAGICHRLDKETSGCLLIAKNPKALVHALKEFKERRVEKEYLALVHGLVSPSEGTMRLPLARTKFDREKFEVRYSGKMAETSWKVEKFFNNSTLVRLFPKTGRTHQIRVHLSHLGYPIWSDERYLRKDFLVKDRENLNHHFLHAEILRLTGVDGERIEVRADLPEDEVKLLSWISGE